MLENLWTSTPFGTGMNDSARKAPNITSVAALSQTKFLFAKRSNNRERSTNINGGKAEKITVSLVDGKSAEDLTSKVDATNPRSFINSKPLPSIPLNNDAITNIDNSAIDNDRTLTEKKSKSGRISDEMTSGHDVFTTSDLGLEWDTLFHPSSTFETSACQPFVAKITDVTNPITQKNGEIQIASLPNVYEPRSSPVRDSVAIKPSRDIDRYRILYKIKYDNRKSRDSCITIDGGLSIRPPKTSLTGMKVLWGEYRDKKQQLPVVCATNPPTPKGQYFFWAGFVCPIIWFVGSRYLPRDSTAADVLWRKRCNRAFVAAAVALTCALIVVFITHPKIFTPRVSINPPMGTTVYKVD